MDWYHSILNLDVYILKSIYNNLHCDSCFVRYYGVSVMSSYD